MLSLKISSFLKQINKVKVRIGLSSSNDDSLAEGNASVDAGSSSREEKHTDENSVQALGAGIIPRSEAVNKLYKLEVDEKGRRLCFTWALNMKKRTKRKSIGPSLKRARTNILSSSTANYGPSRQPGGVKLKFINDPSLESEEDSEQRMCEVNENEGEEELDEGFYSTSKPAVGNRNQCRQRTTCGYEGRTSEEKRGGHSSKSGGFRQNNNKAYTSDISPENFASDNNKMMSSREYFAHTNNSFGKQGPLPPEPGTKMTSHTNFLSGAILLGRNVPEQERKEAPLAGKSPHEIMLRYKGKRKADCHENPETNDLKPATFKALKAEVKWKDVKSSTLGNPCNDGMRHECKSLILQSITQATRNPKCTSEPDFHPGRRNADDVHDSSSRDPVPGQEPSKEQSDDEYRRIRVAFFNKIESETGASGEDAIGVQLPCSETENFMEKQTATIHKVANCDVAFQGKAVEVRPSYNDEMNNENVAAPDCSHVHSPAPAINDICKNELSEPYGHIKESLVALGVTEEELLEAFLDHGLSIKANDLLDKFGDRLKTVEAQDSFLQLLKTHCKPEEKNGEYYVVFGTC